MSFNPPVPQIEKTNWDGFNGELYSGWQYVVLRKEFTKSYPKPNNSIPKILVSMGGTDEMNMTGFVIDSLSLINEKFKAIIIVGFGYPHLIELRNSLKSLRNNFELHQNPDNIATIMSQSDFAVISFGQTAYELAALQVPAIYLCLTTDHFESSKLFINEGIGNSLGIYSEEKKQDLVKAIQLYVNEKQLVNEMYDRAGLLNSSNLMEISSLILG